MKNKINDNEHIEVYQDYFIDFAGRKHNFVIAAVSQEIPTFIENIHDDVDYSINAIGEKVLKIGISICHPSDEFDQKLGITKAVGRARKYANGLYATFRGYINTDLVKAFLLQEADYIKNNPEQYIAGYKQEKEKWMKNNNIKEIEKNFSELERLVVEKVNKDPHFLDNVNEYLKWSRK